MATVSMPGELKHDRLPARRKIGWLLESLRKYAVDFSVNFSKKGGKDLLQLHKTVQEELKDGAFLKVCNDQERQKLDSISRSEKEIIKMEKTQEEMNVMKLKNEISAEKLDANSPNKFPPEQVKEKTILNPDRKRIMIRSRL